MMWDYFLGVGLWPSVMVKIRLNATAYKEIRDNFMHPNFQNEFGEFTKQGQVGVEELQLPGKTS